MTIYFNIRNTGSIKVTCDYGTHQYVGCNRSMYESNHEIIGNYYYSCNAETIQQFEPACEFCPGNKHREYMNRIRLENEEEQE